MHWSNFFHGGNQWSGWSSYLSFFRHVAKLDLPIYEKFHHYEAATIHAGPRFMHRKFCIVSDRPTVVQKDESHRPHCADGPQQAWRDGWELYYWRGTAVPRAWIVDRASVDPSVALTDPNIERRRCAAEILGWEKVLASVTCKVIDRAPCEVCNGRGLMPSKHHGGLPCGRCAGTGHNPEIGELLSVDLPGAPGSCFLRVRCGTGRVFCIPIPATCKTALEGNAWTYGIEPDELRSLEART